MVAHSKNKVFGEELAVKSIAHVSKKYFVVDYDLTKKNGFGVFFLYYGFITLFRVCIIMSNIMMI